MHKSDFEAFQKNPVWLEIVSTLEEVRAGLLQDFEELDPVTQATSIARQQGRKKMLDYVLILPEDILQEIEMKEKEKEERRTDDGTRE